MRLLTAFILTVLFCISQAQAVPFWGDKTSRPPETTPASLKPGQFIWNPQASPAGPIVVLVSLNEQRAYVYRNGIVIGITSVSTGRPGHVTPTGVFTVLQKDKDHHSSIYNNAAMPYTERLTWGGVSLHAGGLPGHPSSHGCVHMPSKFAQDLFEVSPMGMTVVISDEHSAPADIYHPPMFAPVDPKTGEFDEESELATDQEFRWEPEKSPEGPVSLLASGADKRLFVFRNGIEIARAELKIEDPDKALGTHVFMAASSGTSGVQWKVVGISTKGAPGADPKEVSRLRCSKKCKEAVSGLLKPGITLMVTDEPVLKSTTNVPLRVMTADSQKLYKK